MAMQIKMMMKCLSTIDDILNNILEPTHLQMIHLEEPIKHTQNFLIKNKIAS